MKTLKPSEIAPPKIKSVEFENGRISRGSIHPFELLPEAERMSLRIALAQYIATTCAHEGMTPAHECPEDSNLGRSLRCYNRLKNIMLGNHVEWCVNRPLSG